MKKKIYIYILIRELSLLCVSVDIVKTLLCVSVDIVKTLLCVSVDIESAMVLEAVTQNEKKKYIYIHTN